MRSIFVTFVVLVGLIFATTSRVAYGAQIQSNKLQIGRGANSDIVLEFLTGQGSANPKLKYNSSNGHIQLANDGVSFGDISANANHSTGYEPELFVLNGGITVLDDVDGVRRAETAKSITEIVVCDKANSTSDSVTVRVNYGPSLGSNSTVALASGAVGYGCTSSTPSISLNTNDLQNVDVTAVAGSPEDLTVKLIY